MSWEAVTELGIRVLGGAILGLEITTASIFVTRAIILSSSVLSSAGCALSPMVPS